MFVLLLIPLPPTTRNDDDDNDDADIKQRMTYRLLAWILEEPLG
jgi:hypothetical protein